MEYRPWYYQQYVDDIFVLFKPSDHLKRFQSYLSSCHVNMSFTIETEQNNNISFLDANVICDQSKFITSVYRKPTFSAVYTHFDTYKTCMIYTLVNRCFQICCSWSMFHQQLILLREIFQKNGYAENFILIDLISDGETTFWKERLVDVIVINLSVIAYNKGFFKFFYYSYNFANIFLELLISNPINVYKRV